MNRATKPRLEGKTLCCVNVNKIIQRVFAWLCCLSHCDTLTLSWKPRKVLHLCSFVLFFLRGIVPHCGETAPCWDQWSAWSSLTAAVYSHFSTSQEMQQLILPHLGQSESKMQMWAFEHATPDLGRHVWNHRTWTMHDSLSLQEKTPAGLFVSFLSTLLVKAAKTKKETTRKFQWRF